MVMVGGRYYLRSLCSWHFYGWCIMAKNRRRKATKGNPVAKNLNINKPKVFVDRKKELRKNGLEDKQQEWDE